MGVPHAWRAAGRALWVEMVAPRPRPDGSDTFFLGSAPEGAGAPIDVRDPRNRHLFLLTEGEMGVDRLKGAVAPGRRRTSAQSAGASPWRVRTRRASCRPERNRATSSGAW